MRKYITIELAKVLTFFALICTTAITHAAMPCDTPALYDTHVIQNEQTVGGKLIGVYNLRWNDGSCGLVVVEGVFSNDRAVVQLGYGGRQPTRLLARVVSNGTGLEFSSFSGTNYTAKQQTDGSLSMSNGEESPVATPVAIEQLSLGKAPFVIPNPEDIDTTPLSSNVPGWCAALYNVTNGWGDMVGGKHPVRVFVDKIDSNCVATIKHGYTGNKNMGTEVHENLQIVRNSHGKATVTFEVNGFDFQLTSIGQSHAMVHFTFRSYPEKAVLGYRKPIGQAKATMISSAD
ncbi:MAG: hypothetical protein ACI9VM_000885 [Candidatus Azotimanducaceae bacterium]|jgi:hypothetical protein